LYFQDENKRQVTVRTAPRSNGGVECKWCRHLCAVLKN